MQNAPAHRIEYGRDGTSVMAWVSYASPEAAERAFNERAETQAVGQIVSLYQNGEFVGDMARFA